MLKTVFLLCCIAASVYCRPQFGFLTDALQEVAKKVVPAIIQRYDFLNGPQGYFFNVDTSDGFHHDAKGELKPGTTRGNEDEGESLEVTGSYSYIGDDGLKYQVFYTADKDGFHPSATHFHPSAGVKKLGCPGLTSGAVSSLAGCGLG